MQNLTKRLDSLEKTRSLIERPPREWATPDLCRLLAQSTPEQLRELVPDKASLDGLIESIREQVPGFGGHHAKP